MALLNIYTNPLTKTQVSHLFRRVSFGATSAQLLKFTGKTAEVIITTLVANQPLPKPSTDSDNKTFHDLAFGFPDSDSTARNNRNARELNFTKRWWESLMIEQNDSIVEKMTLFWQNHFVSTVTEVQDSRYIVRQNELIRKYALGNFRTFVIEITKDPAMLYYLNGNQNVAGKPNENYARELQELFTIGRGNFDENDVKNASKVLTGWKPIGYRNALAPEIGVEFRPNLHDTSDKTFSAFYQNKVIKGRNNATAGDDELAELVDMILAQKETARYLIRKIYRWFIQSDISQQIENEVIEPLAIIFRKNYEIKPVIEKLFKSQHFFDENLLGSQIKSPLDLIIGTLNQFNIKVPNPISDRTSYDLFLNYMHARAKELQMDVLDQPSVFGWRPYYDTDFYELWISSTTLALRGVFTDKIVVGSVSMKYNIDALNMAKRTSEPSSPEKLIDELTETLFSIPITKQQKDYLIDNVLIEGLPRYEWGLEWNNYTADPNNANKRNAVKMKLDSLFTFMLRMAEFQMG